MLMILDIYYPSELGDKETALGSFQALWDMSVGRPEDVHSETWVKAVFHTVPEKKIMHEK